jgi:G:T-mismatch repair DNA endonuclease (very short patch repair protein)
MNNKCQNEPCENYVSFLKDGKTYAKFCSVTCKNTWISRQGAEKRKATCIARYGVSSNLTAIATKEKIKTTCLQRYGTDHPMKTDHIKQKVSSTKKDKFNDPKYNNREKFKKTWQDKSDNEKLTIKNKTKQTNLERYGTEHTFQAPDIKEKINNTNLDKWGYSNPAKSPIIVEKIKNTQIQKFGSHYNQRHILSDNLKLLNDKDWLESNKDRPSKELANIVGVTYYTIDYAYEKHQISRIKTIHSMPEHELAAFIESLGIDIIKNDRSIIKKELDIFIPSLNLALEMNGMYWHCELSGGKDKFYHLDKTKKCNEKNIRLIHILDSEWYNNTELVKSRIISQLGISNRISARQCNVVCLDSKTANSFLIDNHIQGSSQNTWSIGLEYQNQLIAVMTFGKPRYNKKFQWELLRFASQRGITVVGGASKLLSFFKKEKFPTSIISYSDNRWGNGNVYLKLGFEFSHSTDPNYFYTKNYNQLYSRIKFQKHKLLKQLDIFDSSLSEWQNMQINGWDRIWDCGNGVWHWHS